MPKNGLLSSLFLAVLLSIPGFIHADYDAWGKQIKEALQAQRKGDLKAAEKKLLAALLVTEDFNAEDPRAAYTLDYLATLYQQDERLEEALPVYERALKGFDKTLGPNSEESLSEAGRLAEAFESAERWSQAEPLRRRLLEAVKAGGTKDGAGLAQAESDLALSLDAQKKYDEAGSLYESALQRRKIALGEESAEVGETLNNLGRLWLMKGDAVKAEQLLRQALAVDTKVLGPQDPGVADDLHRLASILRKAGKDAQAQEADAKAEAITAAVEEKKQGPSPKAAPLPKPRAVGKPENADE